MHILQFSSEAPVLGGDDWPSASFLSSYRSLATQTVPLAIFTTVELEFTLDELVKMCNLPETWFLMNRKRISSYKKDIYLDEWVLVCYNSERNRSVIYWQNIYLRKWVQLPALPKKKTQLMVVALEFLDFEMQVTNGFDKWWEYLWCLKDLNRFQIKLFHWILSNLHVIWWKNCFRFNFSYDSLLWMSTGMVTSNLQSWIKVVSVMFAFHWNTGIEVYDVSKIKVLCHLPTICQPIKMYGQSFPF